MTTEINANIVKLSECNRAWTSAHKIPGNPWEPAYVRPVIDRESAAFKEGLAQLEARMAEVGGVIER